MLLLRNNQLVRIDTAEDDYSNLTAVQLKESITAGEPVRNRIWTLYRNIEGYIFKVTQSPYESNSYMGAEMGYYMATIGDAIMIALERGYLVSNNGIKITKPKDEH